MENTEKIRGLFPRKVDSSEGAQEGWGGKLIAVVGE